MDETVCALCRAARERAQQVAGVNSHLVSVIPDAYPSAAGHLLIVPTRHVGRLQQLTLGEHNAVFEAVYATMRDPRFAGQLAHGATVGVNDGPNAGQTIAHLHVHIIPRASGDVPDPRGGIRWVLPHTAAYWNQD